MPKRGKEPKALNTDSTYVGIRKKDSNFSQHSLSVNETPVDLLEPELRRWIKIIKPSRASLTYERYE